jgi:hypothetical protein
MMYGPRVQFGDSPPDMMRPMNPMTSTKLRQSKEAAMLDGCVDGSNSLKPPTTSGVAIPHRRRIACQQWNPVVAKKSKTKIVAAAMEGS